MTRRSKLDEHADWLIMRSNQSYGKIAQEYTKTFGTTVTDDGIRKWFISRNKSDLHSETKFAAETIKRVTAEVLEGEWIRQLNEVRENYTKAKQDGDTRGMAEWNRQAQYQVSMLLKAWQPIQVQIASSNQTDNLKERLWKALGPESTKSSFTTH